MSIVLINMLMTHLSCFTQKKLKMLMTHAYLLPVDALGGQELLDIVLHGNHLADEWSRCDDTKQQGSDTL